VQKSLPHAAGAAARTALCGKYIICVARSTLILEGKGGLTMQSIWEKDTERVRFEALDGDTLLGKCTMVLGEKFADVTKLSFEDGALFIGEGLLKSAYNYAAVKNYYMAKCSVSDIDSLLLRLGFQKQNEEYICDIPTILMGSCGSCNSK
jgi:hypothetical protein